MIKQAKQFWVTIFNLFISIIGQFYTDELFFDILFFFMMFVLIFKFGNLGGIELLPEWFNYALFGFSISEGEMKFRKGSDAYFFIAKNKYTNPDAKGIIGIDRIKFKEIIAHVQNTDEAFEYLRKTYNAILLSSKEHLEKFHHGFDFGIVK